MDGCYDIRGLGRNLEYSALNSHKSRHILRQDRAYGRFHQTFVLQHQGLLETNRVLHRTMPVQEDQSHLQASKFVEGVVMEDLVKGHLILTTSSKSPYPVCYIERYQTGKTRDRDPRKSFSVSVSVIEISAIKFNTASFQQKQNNN